MDGGGDLVDMLTAGTGGTDWSELNLGKRNGDPRRDGQYGFGSVHLYSARCIFSRIDSLRASAFVVQ